MPARKYLKTMAGGGPKQPLFHGEGHPRAAYKHNAPWAKPGPYQTSLGPKKEKRFQGWAKRYERRRGVKVNKEYDYRGWWASASPRERHLAIAKGGHFTDKYKTPYDTSFSNQSKYAKKGTPFVWRGGVLVNRKNGRVIVRESEE